MGLMVSIGAITMAVKKENWEEFKFLERVNTITNVIINLIIITVSNVVVMDLIAPLMKYRKGYKIHHRLHPWSGWESLWCLSS